MIRRLVCVLTLLALLLLPAPVFAGKGGGGKGGGKSAGKSTTSASGEKTVHVRGYTKKDGTKVEAYDRRPSQPGVAKDPVTHQKVGSLDTLEAVPAKQGHQNEAVQVEGVGAVVPTHTYVSSSGVRMVVGHDSQGRLVVGNVDDAPKATAAAPSASASTTVRSAVAAPTSPARSRGSSTVTSTPHSSSTSTHKTACASCPRDDHGRLARSEAAKRQFETRTGYPHGRPGYVVDHIKPLACGGLDGPSNMQWQTVAAAKAKDKTERVGCR